MTENKKSNSRKQPPSDLGEKIIGNLSELIALQKEQIEIMNDNLEEFSERIMFSEAREWLFFEYIEKSGSSIIDVFEFINEKNIFKNSEFKKMLIDDMMHSHKKYQEERNLR